MHLNSMDPSDCRLATKKTSRNGVGVTTVEWLTETKMCLAMIFSYRFSFRNTWDFLSCRPLSDVRWHHWEEVFGWIVARGHILAWSRRRTNGEMARVSCACSHSWHTHTRVRSSTIDVEYEESRWRVSQMQISRAPWYVEEQKEWKINCRAFSLCSTSFFLLLREKFVWLVARRVSEETK